MVLKFLKNVYPKDYKRNCGRCVLTRSELRDGEVWVDL